MSHNYFYLLLILLFSFLTNNCAFAFDGYTVHGFRKLEFGDSIKTVVEKTNKFCSLKPYWEEKNESQYRCSNFNFLGKSFDFSARFLKGKLTGIGLSMPHGIQFYKTRIESDLIRKYGKPVEYGSRFLVLEFKDGVSVLLGDNDGYDNIFISYSSKEEKQLDSP